jgi:predicted ester cyclase
LPVRVATWPSRLERALVRRMAAVVEAPIRERLRWQPDPATYETIRRLWIDHSKAEDGRDLAGLIATLAPDCVYEIVPTGQRWEGHLGATRFYTSFLSAFPDVKFDLQDIVIGPQGVIEITRMSGTHVGEWAGQPATGQRVETLIVIHFPWDPAARKFAGERIYFDTRAFDLTPL